MSNLLRYKEASSIEVENHFINNIPEITPYQKDCIKNDEIFRFSPYTFYKETEKVSNPLIRISILLYWLIWLLLFIGLPFNFIFTGRWGYKKINWFAKWTTACGL